MDLLEKIEQDFKEALRQRQGELLEILRGLKTALHNKQIELRLKNKELEEEEVMEVLRREVKKRQEAEEMFKQGNRLDLAEKEEKEMVFLKQYLPEELADDKIKEISLKVIAELGATGKQDFGKVMGRVMIETNGRAEGNRVKKIVEELLS